MRLTLPAGPGPRSSQGPRLLRVDAEQAGRRVDNFLAAVLKGVPRSRIYRMLRTGEVRVNGGRVTPAARLQSGDLVRIPPLRPSSTAASPPPPRLLAVAGRILHEDARLLVIDKPAGVAVHGGSGVRMGVIEALRASTPGSEDWELAHRLDRDTSGCLMVAKRPSALRRLHEMLRHGEVRKRYLALLRGRWTGGERTLRERLRKNVRRGGERVVQVHPDGKEAVSVFRPLEQFAQACLVEVELTTGRTHQIRVHAAHAGHPVAGDEKYGDAAFNKALRALGLRRLFLHAAGLAIPAWEGGRPLAVCAPLPPELEQVLEHLRRRRRRE